MKHRHQQGSHRSVATEFSQSVPLTDLEVRPEKNTYHDNKQSPKERNIIHTVHTSSMALYVSLLCYICD